MMQAIRKRIDDDKGFTLIELMVVVLIIAILIAIAIPTFLGLRQRAQDRAAQSDLRNGLTAAKAFYTDGETYGGFDAGVAAGIEPSLSWANGGGAVENVVAIEEATDANLTLVTASDSEVTFCIADSDSVGTVRGDSASGTYGTTFLTCASGNPDLNTW